MIMRAKPEQLASFPCDLVASDTSTPHADEATLRKFSFFSTLYHLKIGLFVSIGFIVWFLIVTLSSLKNFYKAK